MFSGNEFDDKTECNALFLDDIRPLPNGYTHYVNTAEDAITALKNNNFNHVSLDHDLGYDKTGQDVIDYIEEAAFNGELKPLDINIHTANPVGRERMLQAAKNTSKYWKSKFGIDIKITTKKY